MIPRDAAPRVTSRDGQSAWRDVLAPVHQQIDLDGRLHDLAPAHERMRLFEPAPVQIAGQTYLDTDREETKQ